MSPSGRKSVPVCLALAIGAAVGVAADARAVPTPVSRKPFRIVIDPGHGGGDEGTVFDSGMVRIAEKDVTLALAKQVARNLSARGYTAILTRENDQEVSLPHRTGLANRLGADVFLSIHMNSAHSPHAKDAEGIETYILNHASDAASKRLAHLENTPLSTGATAGADTPEKADVALILKDLRLDANLTESKLLACAIQKNLVLATSPQALQGGVRKASFRVGQKPSWKNRNRGVKQALFHVLLGADMPSVLVEAGFLSSSQDRSFVLSPLGQKKMSWAIVRAIEQYKTVVEKPEATTALSNCTVR